jgi:Leucine-rich repeat (LRR) protein
MITLSFLSRKAWSFLGTVVFVPMMVVLLFVLLPRALPAHAQTTDCGDVTTLPLAECEALVTLYESTDGENWTDNTDWNQTNEPCTWFGITCQNNSVTHLLLPDNNLNGPLPSEVGNLSGLISLNLNDNNLSGGIPQSLGTLINLQFLNMKENPLGGTLPANLGNSNTLQRIDLRSTGVSGSIPPEWGNIASLDNLAMSGNKLSGPLPPELGNLTNLTSMNFGENSQLTGTLPDTFANLTSLNKIEIDGTQIGGPLPSWLSTLPLVDIRLDDNQLSGPIPADLGNLATLKELNIQGNNLTGSIPFELGKLTNLDELRLARNNLTGEVPTSLTNLIRLTSLNLDYNCLRPVYDDELAAFIEPLNPDWQASQCLVQNVAPGGDDISFTLGVTRSTQLDIPAQSIAEAGTVTMTVVLTTTNVLPADTIMARAMIVQLVAQDGSPRDFVGEVTFTLHYTDEELETAGITDEQTLGILALQESGAYELLPPAATLSAVIFDYDTNTVTFTTTQATEYVLASSGMEASEQYMLFTPLIRK